MSSPVYILGGDAMRPLPPAPPGWVESGTQLLVSHTRNAVCARVLPPGSTPRLLVGNEFPPPDWPWDTWSGPIRDPVRQILVGALPPECQGPVGKVWIAEGGVGRDEEEQCFRSPIEGVNIGLLLMIGWGRARGMPLEGCPTLVEAEIRRWTRMDPAEREAELVLLELGK